MDCFRNRVDEFIEFLSDVYMNLSDKQLPKGRRAFMFCYACDLPRFPVSERESLTRDYIITPGPATIF